MNLCRFVQIKEYDDEKNMYIFKLFTYGDFFGFMYRKIYRKYYQNGRFPAGNNFER